MILDFSLTATIRLVNAKEFEVDAQEYAMDAFSEVLRLFRLEVSIYHNAKVCGDWRIAEHVLGASCFHLVTTGSCLLDVPGHFSGQLGTGDLVIFPRELVHTMVPVTPMTGVQMHVGYRAGIQVEGTGLLCGEMRFQHAGSRYILDALPPVLVLDYEQNREWLCPLLDLILRESMNQGFASKVLIDKVAELLFVYALRQYVIDSPDNVLLLGAYGHSSLAKVISAIHEHPEQVWTLEAMAKVAALSRTTFAETFKAKSGWTPGQYLFWWRMQLAWSLLSEGESVAVVAGMVGYQSESAFSRGFQKMFAVSAGKVRRGVY